MATRNSDLRKFRLARFVVLAVVLVGVTFGLTYIFGGAGFLGNPRLTLGPGVYKVVEYHQGEREFLLWLRQKDTEAPAQYYSIPSSIVVVKESLTRRNVLEVIKKRGWTRVNLYVDP